MSNDNWATPGWLYHYANTVFGPFDCDVCASEENAKVDRYFTIEDDALKQEWGENNWCNPPYSNIGPWVEAAMRAPGPTTFLVPADFSTDWAKRLEALSNKILLLNMRIKFVGASQGARFASMLCQVGADRWGEKFEVIPRDYLKRYEISYEKDKQKLRGNDIRGKGNYSILYDPEGESEGADRERE